MTEHIDPPVMATLGLDESDTDPPAPDAEARESAIASLLSRKNWPLLVTIGVDAVLISLLSAWNFTMTDSPSAVFGSLLLLAVAIACVWAFCALLYECPTRLTAPVISQVLVAVLAGYIILLDTRTPAMQWIGASGLALILGLAAVFWVVRLGRYAGLKLAKGAAVLFALVPVVGVYQYWMETDYIPQSSKPLIDGMVELTPIGNPDSGVLQAKVTLQNRGSIDAVVAGGLMRVTTYQTGALDNEPAPEEVAQGMDLTGIYYGADYRAVSTLAATPRLIYADDFLTPGDRLPPGGKFEYKRAINIDKRYATLARLTVDAVFVTAQGVVQSKGTCDSMELAAERVGSAMGPDRLQSLKDGTKLLCVESKFAARNALQRLLSDNPVMNATVMLGGPTTDAALPPQGQGMEYPRLFVSFASKNVPGQGQKAERSIPNFVIRNLVAEYSLGGVKAPDGGVVQAANATN